MTAPRIVRSELRLSGELDERCKAQAQALGVSFNQWASMVLGMAVGFDEQLALAVEVWGPAAVKARRLPPA